MNLKILNFYIALIFFILTSFNINAETLDGRTSIKYDSHNHIFKDTNNYVLGFVRLENGFTLTPTNNVILFFDGCIPISGAIDLRETNTLFLLKDLILDSVVTLSSSGNISGYDKALILNGNLTIPDGKIIHTNGRLIIDGNGNKLTLGNSAQLFVDANSTLTLRNLVLQNTRNQQGHPCIQCASVNSTLYLDNVELKLKDDFYFNRGQFFIQNDVAISGTSAFVYHACQPSFINSRSTLNFDLGTTFSIAPATFTDCLFSTFPTTTTNNFISMSDQTSRLYLNGCSLFSTLTGIRFTQGSLHLDNHVTMKSNASNTFNSINSAYTTSIGTSPQSICVSWSPDGRFIAVINGYSTRTLQIYRFNGNSAPTAVGGTVAAGWGSGVNWSPDGRFIAANDNNGYLGVYSFNGSSTPTKISSSSTSSSALSWAPDGQYIAIVNLSSNLLAIFKFTGAGTLTQVSSTTISGTYTRSVSWSPDSRFIAVGNDSTGIRVYNFDGSKTLTQVGGSAGVPNSPVAISFSPDGRFISAGIYNWGLYIYRFNGRGSPIQVGTYGGSCGGGPQAVMWSPDGRFIALVNGSRSNTLQIYSFDGNSTINQLANIGTSTYPEAVAWSPEGNFIAVINRTSSVLTIYKVNYIINAENQALYNSIVFGNSNLGPDCDLNIKLLSAAKLEVDGKILYDNLN